MDLVAKGVVRIIDAAVVKANEDGSSSACRWRTSAGQRGVADDLCWASGILSNRGRRRGRCDPEAGRCRAVIMYENTWSGLRGGHASAGGELVAFERIPAADVIAAIEAA